MTELNVDEIRQQDRAHGWHPLMQHSLLDKRDLMVVQEGNGATLIDAEGRTHAAADARRGGAISFVA